MRKIKKRIKKDELTLKSKKEILISRKKRNVQIN